MADPTIYLLAGQRGDVVGVPHACVLGRPGRRLPSGFQPLKKRMARNQNPMPKAEMRNLPPVNGGVETTAADFVFADDTVGFIDGQGGVLFVHVVLVILDNFV